MEFTLRIRFKSHEERSCKQKVRYGHQETAETAAKRMAEKYSKKYDIYECCYCDGWHIATAIDDDE